MTEYARGGIITGPDPTPLFTQTLLSQPCGYVLQEMNMNPNQDLEQRLEAVARKSTARHPSTQHLLDLLAYDHLPPHLQEVSKPFSDLGHNLADTLGNSPEVGAGLRKLVEAKDCFVRQAVIDARS